MKNIFFFLLFTFHIFFLLEFIFYISHPHQIYIVISFFFFHALFFEIYLWLFLLKFYANLMDTHNTHSYCISISHKTFFFRDCCYVLHTVLSLLSLSLTFNVIDHFSRVIPCYNIKYKHTIDNFNAFLVKVFV